MEGSLYLWHFLRNLGSTRDDRFCAANFQSDNCAEAPRCVPICRRIWRSDTRGNVLAGEKEAFSAKKDKLFR